MNSVGLISTLHDPEGRMSEFLHRCMPDLTKLYSFLVVVDTPSTSRQTTDILAMYKAEVYPDASRYIGVSRRKALELGLRHAEARYFHYCDFDRLIHWTLTYLDELRTTVVRTIQQSDFLIIGRTAKAFDTHPQVQKETEALTNRVFSFIFGRPMDVTAGSCGMSRPAAKEILKSSTELSNATDTEWPMIIHCLARPKLSIDYVKVQGLEFETSTFFGDDAFKRADTTENWLLRVRLCRESIEAAIRVRTQSHENINGGPE